MSVNVRVRVRGTTALPAIAAFLALFAIGVDNYIMIAILPQLGVDFGRSASIIGLLSSAYALPLALLAPLFGPISDRIGRRRTMIAGMTTFLIAIGASGLAPTYEFLLAARFINGLGAAIFVPAAYAYVADRSKPETRAKAMSTLMTSFPAAALLGLPLGGFITSACGWRGVFGFIGLVAVLALLILWTLPEDHQPGTQITGYREGLRRVLGDPKVLKVISVTLLWMAAAGGSGTYIGQFFHEKYKLNSDQIGLVLMVIGVAGISATRLGAHFINRVGTRRSVLFGIAAFGVAILILPWTPVMPVSILVYGFWAFGTWFGFPAQQTIVSELGAGMRGTVLSFNTSAQYMGAVIGPVISGAVLEAGSFPVFGIWGTFLASCTFVLALYSLPRQPKKLAGQ